MSKLELTTKHIKNAKIKKDLLKKICFYYSRDLTASLTAKKLELSRQTINHYYKIIRETIIFEQDKRILYDFKNNFFDNCLDIKYIKINQMKLFYLDYENKIYFLDQDSFTPLNMNKYFKVNIKESLANHKKASLMRVILNKNKNEFIVSGYFLSNNSEVEDFLKNHLKKFRGLNKDNISTHIQESQFRFNYKESSIFNTLINIFDL